MDEDSILTSIKKLLGIGATDESFDTDILIHINTVFSVLHNIGAAPPAGFFITGPDEKWSDFLADRANVQMVKTYMYLKVRIVFDPPATSFALTAMEKMAAELEWRLNTMELTFNPAAYGADLTTTHITEITQEVSSDAKVGDIAIDPVTGDIYRVVS